MRRFLALTTLLFVVAALLPTGVVGANQSGRFDDVSDSHTFAEEIEWLADTGITLGCNPPDNTLFCPDEAVTRGQMAAFLTRGLGLPSAPDQGFEDADGVFYDNINSLAAAGITIGCNPPDNTLFCPDEAVTRGQIAAFLYRGLEDSIPPTTTSSTTTTVPDTTTTSSTTTTLPNGDFEPFTINGSGNDVVDFRIPGDVPAVVDFTHEGSSNFIVWSLDSNHDDIDLLVNVIGTYEGRRMVHGGWFSEPEPVRHLEIDADGSWSITARPMSAARRFGTSLNGSGDDIVLYTGSSPTMTSTHDGESNFIIVGYFRSGEYNELIVNEIGPYSGQDVIDSDTEILDIQGDGTWTLETP